MTVDQRPSEGLEAYRYRQVGQVQLYLGDARQVLAAMPGACVDSIVTSPPFWSLRDYGTGAWRDGDPACAHPLPADRRTAGAHCADCGAVWTDPQYGLEPTVEDYVTNLVDVFTEARRVLTPTGTCWLNLGDSYTGGGRRAHTTTGPGQATVGDQPAARLPAKHLIGVPWRVAFALQASGWWLRNAVIWSKTNHLSPFCLCCS